MAAAAAAAPDVTVLVNNAGVLAFGGVLDGDLDFFERDLRTNYLGTLRVTREFIPVLARNAPAALVNVLTLIALAPVAPMVGYGASKAAAHSMTQALRPELRGRGIEVLGAYWPADRTRRRPGSAERPACRPTSACRGTLPACLIT